MQAKRSALFGPVLFGNPFPILHTTALPRQRSLQPSCQGSHYERTGMLCSGMDSLSVALKLHQKYPLSDNDLEAVRVFQEVKEAKNSYYRVLRTPSLSLVCKDSKISSAFWENSNSFTQLYQICKVANALYMHACSYSAPSLSVSSLSPSAF